MIKLALSAFVFGGYAFASGWGDYEPPRYDVKYECVTRQQDVSVKMSYYGTEYKLFPIQKIFINGVDGAVEFDTNQVVKANVDRYYKASTQPSGLGNASLQVLESGVAGYAYYRNDNHHIEVYSNKDGTKSNSIDIFIFDLNRKTKRSFLKVPCVLTIKTIPGTT